MHVLDESDLLLDLLREAGDEPVTLGELEVVGVRDPAQALLALELAGHAVHRVYEVPRPGRTITCVRLGAPRPEPAPAPEPAPVAAAPAPPSAPSRTVVAALIGLLLVALVAAARRPR